MIPDQKRENKKEITIKKKTIDKEKKKAARIWRESEAGGQGEGRRKMSKGREGG